MAGGIGRLADYKPFRDFLCSVCQKFEQVYLMLGNHELFGVSREEGLKPAEKLQNDSELKDKLTVMNRKRADLEDVTLLGCTLHSHIRPESGDFGEVLDSHRQLRSQLYRYRSSEVLSHSYTSRQDRLRMKWTSTKNGAKSHSSACESD
ncbi:hypothetical protein PAAG_05324 [Paracoccidioides lutzii Pb01]|uniref:Calcineurin-like phosphoesterase domain-containing protein n=1 Tax=Paracoccidioides lutzii (strain ATCC MYA-826 / Pb01) TaxID=502779 RepID=C1H3I1_PARBA|nr:hypothetical protein PAAG_05324 [Paracoccidioides lutzii Pb01]EEH34275.2 hypothetical protein PAAG_05324 [Paracoccidioides lutzii Pb01]